MKKIIIGTVAALLAATVGAHAQAQSGSSSDNNVNVRVESNGSRIPDRTSVRTTGSAIAPGLTAGAIVCAQSTSIGGGFMGGAFAFGTTREDKDCNDRAWIATLGAMAGATNNGRYIQSAHNVACANKTAGRAMREAGFVCPGDDRRTVSAQAAPVRNTAGFREEARRQERATDLRIVQTASSTNGSARQVKAAAAGQRQYNHIDGRWGTRDARGKWVY